MEAKNFGWPVPSHVNHHFGPGVFNAYSLMGAKTLCGLSYMGLSPEETMTSGQRVTCVRCIAIDAGLCKP